MRKTIFYKQNRLHIDSKVFPEFKHVIPNPDVSHLKYILDLLLNSRDYEALLVGNKSKILKQIKRQFLHIKAAGGLVLNSKNEVLLIKRQGKWDLPKGKLEEGETKREGAVREVEEECGIQGLKILRKLSPSYHIYSLEGKWALKTSYWYLMKYEGKALLRPQAEEHITEARWVAVSRLNTGKFKTYPAIEKVLHQSLFLSV